MADQPSRRRPGWGLISPLLLVGLLVSAAWATVVTTPDPAPADRGPVGPAQRHAVVVRVPAGPPSVDTGVRDAHGNAVTANCSTCHATREPNRATNDGGQLKDFHTGLTTVHGALTCVSCHHADDYQSLGLADGRTLPFERQIQLCAQCHGPQHRDYVNGSHGGMTGYWDLSRGGRTRNTCTDCHDPHAPRPPAVRPVFAPRDRFLPPPIDHPSPAEGLTGAAPGHGPHPTPSPAPSHTESPAPEPAHD